MLWTMAVILFGLWAMGTLGGAPLGLWIHLFFAFALVAAVLAVLAGARARRDVVPGPGRGAGGAR